ncbi:hypothetical protein AADZ90_006840 [Aestuariibius sp. 2305UL40-4]|uniref:hypothetical protein n=1 Tax=Aestuariibius violaceus TaxID=3234132 RepID=UPI00345ECCB8
MPLLGKQIVAAALFLIAGCSTYDAEGNVATGPFGQQPLFTEDVQMAFRSGVIACAEFKTSNAPLANLASQGFSPVRNGYLIRVDNPRIALGGSRVRVTVRRDECRVDAEPLFPAEITTASRLTRETLAQRGLELDVTLRGGTRSNVGFAQAIF